MELIFIGFVGVMLLMAVIKGSRRAGRGSQNHGHGGSNMWMFWNSGDGTRHADSGHAEDTHRSSGSHCSHGHTDSSSCDHGDHGGHDAGGGGDSGGGGDGGGGGD